MDLEILFLALLLAIPASLAAGVALARGLANPMSAQVRELERELVALRRRVVALEYAHNRAATPAPADPVPRVEPTPPPPAPLPLPLPPPPPPAAAPAAPEGVPLERLAVWVGATLGALLLATGALFGIAAAAEAGWFGPGARVAAGMVFGTLAWVGGASAHRRARWAGAALSAAGASSVFGAVWAATSVYGLVHPIAGFALLIVVVGTTMASADRFRDPYLGALAVVGGLLASTVILADGAAPRLAYALVLNGAVVALAARRDWPGLLALVGVGTAAQLGAFASGGSAADALPALVGVAALTVPFSVVTAFHPGRAHKDVSLVVTCLYIGVAGLWVDPSGPNAGDWGAAWAAGLGALAVVTPAWVAARAGDGWARLAAPVAMGLLLLTAFAASWHGSAPARALVPVAAALVGAAAMVERRAIGAGLLPLFAVAPLLLPLRDAPVAAAGAALCALAAISAIARMTSSHPLAGAVALAPSALAAAVLASAHPGDPAVGVTLLVLAAVHVGVGSVRWAVEPDETWFGPLAAPTVLLPAGYLWWSTALGDSLIGLLPLTTAAITLATAAVLVNRGLLDRQSAPFSVAVIGILGGITLALPLQLHTRWLPVGWALESAALALVTTRLRHPILRYASVGLGVAVAWLLLTSPTVWTDGRGWAALPMTLYAWGVPALSLWVAAHGLERSARGGAAEWTSGLLRSLAVLTAFGLVNLAVSHAFQDEGPIRLTGVPTAQAMVRSLSWGAFGSLLLVGGVRSGSRMARLAGFVFVLLGALKVSLLDAWNLSGLLRVGSLVGLGLFLVASAFAFERLVLRPSRSEEG